MNVGIELISNNMDMTLSTIVLIVSIVGSIIFYAADLKIGLIISFTLGILNIIFAYAIGESTKNSIIVTLMLFVFLSLSLYSSSKTVSGSSLI